MNQSYISSDFVDYTSAVNRINQNALNNSGPIDRSVNNSNSIFFSAKIDGNLPHETTTITLSNNYVPSNVFYQNEAKPSYI